MKLVPPAERSWEDGGRNATAGRLAFVRHAPERPGVGQTVVALWRRKWLVAGVAFAAVLAAAAIAMSMTPRYTAEAKLRIGLPDSRLTEASSGLAGNAVDSATIQSEQHVLTSRDIAGRVSERLALETLPEFNPRLRDPGLLDRFHPRKLLQRFAAPAAGPPRTGPEAEEARRNRVKELTVNSLLARVSAEPLGRSHVISIGASSEDPALAARIANAFGEIYVEEKLVQRADTLGVANNWLSRHIENLRTKLEVSERAVETYRREHALYSGRSDTIAAQQLAELNTLVIAAQSKLAEAETRLQQALRTMKNGTSGSSMLEVLRSPIIQSLKQQQAAVAQRAAELSTKYGSKHPNIQNIDAERRDIERQIRTEIDNVVAALRNEASAAKASYEALVANLEKTKEAMGDTKSESIKLRALEREADANRALFQQFLQRVKETEAQRDMEAVNSRLISRAAVPGSPSSPPVAMMIVLALIVGALAGVLLALLLEQMDDTFRTDDDVEIETALPTLSVVPRISNRRLRNGRVHRQPTSEYGESLRKLAMSLRLDEPRDGARVVMMASSVANEGKSGICLGLARTMAASGANVIVLDCDWRRPQLHTMVNRKNLAGVGELLNGSIRPEDAVFSDPSGAHLIFAGRLRSRHAHLIFSDRMKGLLQSLSKHYDLVLVDTPPVLIGAEVLHLARLVDMTVYVVRWGKTRREVVLRGLRQLAKMDAPLVGTVLSQVDTGRYRRYLGYSPAYGYGWAGTDRAA